MNRLALLVYIMAAPTLAGIIVTALLTAGLTGRYHILIGGLIGFVVAIPAAWAVGRQIGRRRRA
jgi:xanthine/uracil permease